MPGPYIHTKQPPGFSTNPGGFVDKLLRLLDFLLRVGGGLSGGVLCGSSQLPQTEHGGAGRGQRVRVVQALHVREGAQQTAGTKVVVLGGGQLLAQGSRTDRQLGATNFNWLGDLVGAQTRQIGRDINKYVFQMFNDTNVQLTATLDVSSKTTVASLVKTAADNDINPADAIVVLGPADFYKVLAQLDASAYGGTEAIREGYIPGIFGFYGMVCSTFLVSGVKGVIVSRDAVGIASRYI